MKSSEKKLPKSSVRTLKVPEESRQYISMTTEGATAIVLGVAFHMRGDSTLLDEYAEAFDNSIPPTMRWFTFAVPLPQRFL